MQKNKHNSWFANQIAKTYLTAVESLDVLDENISSEEDFIVMSRKNHRIYAVDVKPSKYRLSDIKREYKNLRKNYEEKDKPVVMMYINYEEKTGFFEVIANGHSVGLTPLRVDRLESAISAA